MTRVLRSPGLPHVSCILSHPHNGSVRGASTLAWFLSKLWGCWRFSLAAKLHFHLSAPGNVQQIFILTEAPNCIWLCRQTCLHLFWQLRIKEKTLEERLLYLHPFPPSSVTEQGWLNSALAVTCRLPLANVSPFPRRDASHTVSFPGQKSSSGCEGMVCLSFFVLSELGGLWTHPSHLTTVFQLWTGARNSSELTTPLGPVSHPLLVSAPPGWYGLLQAVTCLVEPLGRRKHPQDLNQLSSRVARLV